MVGSISEEVFELGFGSGLGATGVGVVEYEVSELRDCEGSSSASC